jgi:LysE type translocator
MCAERIPDIHARRSAADSRARRPDSLLVLRNSARGGRRGGVVTAAGTVTGLLVWAAAAALGLAALLRASEIGFLVVRCAGAAYLAFLGSQLIWRARRPHAGHDQAHGDQASALVAVAHRGPLAQYLAGAGTNLLNPKLASSSSASCRGSYRVAFRSGQRHCCWAASSWQKPACGLLPSCCSASGSTLSSAGQACGAR